MPPYRSLAHLLQQGRAEDVPVAWEGESLLGWRELRRCEASAPQQQSRRQRIVLQEDNPFDFLAHLLACLRRGDIPVLPPNFQPQTLAALRALPAPTEPVPECAHRTIELYTSGSSGEPKCVRKTLRQLDAECAVLEHLWGEQLNGASIAATTPHHHIYGLLFRVLWPLCAGRPFDNATCAEPSHLSERLRQLGDSVLISSPAQLARLPALNDLAAMSRKPRLVFSSGGPLAADIAQHYQTVWGAAPIEVFGSTESGGVAWRQRRLTSADFARWWPLPGVMVGVDDEGALSLRSPFLADENPLRMEDAVELAVDGSFTLKGRLDRIVKIEEKRLSLPEMESWLAEHPIVKAVGLVTLVPEGGQRTLVGAVIALDRLPLATQRKQLTETLKAHLRQRYDAVLLPRIWRFVEQLPYSDRGKLMSSALRAILTAPAQEALLP